MATTTKSKKEKPPLTTINKHPTAIVKEGSKPSQQEIEADVLAIAALQKRMLHDAENPFKEKLEKYKSMSSNKELTEHIDKLLKKIEGEVSGDRPGEKQVHSEKTRQAP